DKPIKYVSMNMEAYNRVGDVVKSTIGGDMIKVLRAVGPIEPGLGNGGSFFNSSKTTSYENVWYNNSISCVRVASADIEYMDGSTDTIGPERIADAIKPGIKNTCELGEQLR
ncbi:MAG: hypothetical protein PF630_06530, partial [Gammaproteobacteria bacterium]|nr:hypothetical protein [Gammaproteobacteria bacterium]